MSRQNIFDNETFFEGYKELREKEKNANNLFEIPALFAMLPDLTGKSVLDLGCGFGEHCMEYVKRGATKVVGIDISEKMLEIARKENADPKITYLNMPMEDLHTLSGPFDVVISSLAFHYVEDFDRLVKDIAALMTKEGIFLFSQEHPFSTCYGGKYPRWTKDEKGEKIYLNLESYGREGIRESAWFVEGIKKYHRTFSGVVNTLIRAGFAIEEMTEPLPDDEILKKYPEYEDLFHKPDFLLIRSKRM